LFLPKNVELMVGLTQESIESILLFSRYSFS
jgi:hypothetical protein